MQLIFIQLARVREPLVAEMALDYAGIELRTDCLSVMSFFPASNLQPPSVAGASVDAVDGHLHRSFAPSGQQHHQHHYNCQQEKSTGRSANERTSL